MNKKQRRYSYAALEKFLARTKTDMAIAIGVSDWTLRQWKIEDVPEYAADSLAVRLGLHPSLIWTDWFDIELVP